MDLNTQRQGAWTTSPGAPADRLSRPRGKLRWAVVGMRFLGVSINYLDRANLSIALPDITKEFGLSASVGWLVLAAFFWTYALFQLPAGPFIDRLGARVT